MREYSFIMQQIALLVKADHLASCPEARIYRKSPLLSDRWSQKQLAQVFTEDPDGLYVSLLLCFTDDLVRDGRLDQALVGIVKGKMHLLRQRRCRISSFLAEVIIYLLSAFLRIRIYLEGYISLLLCPERSQKPVRSHPVDRIGEIEIIAVFCRFRFAGLLGFLGHDPPGLEYLSYGLTH